jgi:hypothetical protein
MRVFAPTRALGSARARLLFPGRVPFQHPVRCEARAGLEGERCCGLRGASSAFEPAPPRSVLAATGEPVAFSESDALEPPPPTREDEAAHLESVFAEEVLDRAWGQATEDALERSMVASLPSGSTTAGVECRSTLCRLQVRHTDAAAQLTYSNGLTAAGPLPWEGQVSVFTKPRQSENEPVEETFFFVRPGVVVPSLTQ